jgi:cell fate regulator YaaT (PSP1 superfamily)
MNDKIVTIAVPASGFSRGHLLYEVVKLERETDEEVLKRFFAEDLNDEIEPTEGELDLDDRRLFWEDAEILK